MKDNFVSRLNQAPRYQEMCWSESAALSFPIVGTSWLLILCKNYCLSFRLGQNQISPFEQH